VTHPRHLTADLLLEHSRFLHGLARSLVFDEQQAEDVVQETFAAALRKPPPPHVRLRAWLSVVTRNLALRRRRTEGRLHRREQRAARPEATTPTVDIAVRVELERRIGEAVAALSEPGRSTIVWRYFDGLPPREIARREGVSVRTIESRLRRAREVLRAHLDTEYGGSRPTWKMALLPILGLDAGALASSSSSAAGATAASSATSTVGSGMAVTALAAGATLMSTKLIIAAAALGIAGAFFVGREFPAAPTPSTPDDPAATTPAVGDAPVLHTDAPAVLQRVRGERDAMRDRVKKLTSENEALRAQLLAPSGTAGKPSRTGADRGMAYAPEKYKQALAGVTWPEAGEAAAKMVPLLAALAADFVAGKSVNEKIGLEIFKWNQKLQTVAVTAISAKVPGAEGNGPFTHPSVSINLIHAALTEAGMPLDENQTTRLGEIGDRFIEADQRRSAGYNDETFALQKTIDECALKDRMFADIDGVLTAKQREVLHPEAIQGRLGVDIYSSGTIWYSVARAVDFDTAADLAPGLVRAYLSRAKVDDQQKALLVRAAEDWARSFSSAYLAASADPLAQTSRKSAAGGALAGWQRIEQVRTAATRQLALNRALVELLRGNPTAAQIQGDRRVFVPLKRP